MRCQHTTRFPVSALPFISTHLILWTYAFSCLQVLVASLFLGTLSSESTGGAPTVNPSVWHSLCPEINVLMPQRVGVKMKQRLRNLVNSAALRKRKKSDLRPCLYSLLALVPWSPHHILPRPPPKWWFCWWDTLWAASYSFDHFLQLSFFLG